jgi:secreted trypsin-like serine protease
LINDKYVLTAAHCVSSIKVVQLPDYFVVVGAQYKNDTNPVRFKFNAIFVHPKYNDETYDNDIALIELAYRVDFNDSKAGFICLPPSNQVTYPYAGMNATAVGWGRLEQAGTSSYSLQQVQLPILPYTNQYCYSVVQNDTIQFCAGFVEGGKDTCQGDR